MHGVKLATWDFCCNSFRICLIVTGSLFGSLPVHCPVLSGNHVPIKKSDKIIPVSGPVTSGCVQVMFIDILSS